MSHEIKSQQAWLAEVMTLLDFIVSLAQILESGGVCELRLSKGKNQV